MNLSNIIKLPVNALSEKDGIWTVNGSTIRIARVYADHIKRYIKSKHDFPEMYEAVTTRSVYHKIDVKKTTIYIGSTGNFDKRGLKYTANIGEAIIVYDGAGYLTKGASLLLERTFIQNFNNDCKYEKLNKLAPEYCEGEDEAYVNNMFRQSLHVFNCVGSLGMVGVFTLGNENYEVELQSDERTLMNFLEGKRGYIGPLSDNISLNREKRSNGYRAFASQGDASEPAKLNELDNILLWLYDHRDVDGKCRLNEEMASQMAYGCELSTVGKSLKNGYLGAFIPQQRCYLSTLQFIRILSGGVIEFTSLGMSYMNAHKDDKPKYLIAMLETDRWFGVNIRQFARDVSDIVGKISKDEWTYFVSHGGISDYTHSSPVEIADLIFKWRRITFEARQRIRKEYELVYRRKSDKPSSYENHISDSAESYNYVFGSDIFGDHTGLLELFYEYNKCRTLNINGVNEYQEFIFNECIS